MKSFLSHFIALSATGLLLGVVVHICARLGVPLPSAGRDSNGTWARWGEPWGFSAETLGGFSYRNLALVSLLGLFLEMLMIRWVSAEIRIFAYFKNFVLIACFLGFGLGCCLCRRRMNLFALLAPLILLTLLIKLPWQALRNLITILPALLGSASNVHVWGVPSMPLDWQSLLLMALGLAVVAPLFGLLSLVFIPIGQMVGWYLERAPNGILGYTVNVLASLAGILIYTLLCFLYQPPAVWFGAAGVILLLLLWKAPRLRWRCLIALAACVGLLSWPDAKDHVVQWSPYQKLTLAPVRKASQIIAYSLTTNDTWFQQILNLSPAFVSSHPGMFKDAPIEWNAYNLPYHFYPNAPSVLILGAGMGNDVAAALRNGAGRVVAVEIDPLILEDGRRLHFEKPYSSPRVEQVLDDARSYVQNSRDQFDLIVFSLLDSHTTSSSFSNIRIDNYVYTVQALEAAKRLCKPQGIFIVKFRVEIPWIAGRLHALLTRVFARPPLQLDAGRSVYALDSSRFFISGSERTLSQALSAPELAAYVRRHSDVAIEKASLTTDDWPYFYQHEPGLPASVIAISVVLILLCWLRIRRSGVGESSVQWHFFFLGAGFLLLETQIISRFALLFGTTWVVNSIVISGVLVLIVAANLLVAEVRLVRLPLAYGGVFATIAISYVIPMEALFFRSAWLRAVAAASLLGAPVFFASIIFIHSFARAGFSGQALGSNLFGALAGGLLESLSLWTGLKSLLILAALLYLASRLTLPKTGVTGAEAIATSPAT